MTKFLIFLLLLFSTYVSVQAQNISVASFKILPIDLDARVNFPLKDQNGDVCAIIKVMTTESGFSWDGDQLGIVKVEKKTGEYWLYVPYGAKRLTIKHDQLGFLRDYRYPEAITKATVYEMILVSGKITIGVTPVSPTWVTIKSNPEGADVFINDLLKGVTPLPIKLMPGKYTYRIEKLLYNKNAGKFEITGQEKDGKKDLIVELKPAFGTVKINTLPEQGAIVVIDDVETGKTTPFLGEKIKSGTHIITVKKELYQPRSVQIIVKDGLTTEENITLISSSAKVEIETQPSADIYIDGKFVANGSYQGSIPAGVTTFEARKEGCDSDKKDIDISAGDTKIITLSVKQKVGSVEVVSTPIEAKIFLNGISKGITPITLQNIPIGNYELKIEMPEYETFVKTIEIAENKTIEVNEKLKNSIKEDQKKKPEAKKKTDIPKTITLAPGNENEKPKYSSDYYKYKKAKSVWLVFAIGSAAGGSYAYLQASKSSKDYHNALTVNEAVNFSEKFNLNNKISPIAFGIAGFCAVEFILKSGKQRKAKGQTISWYPLPTDKGAALGLVYKF